MKNIHNKVQNVNKNTFKIMIVLVDVLLSYLFLNA